MVEPGPVYALSPLVVDFDRPGIRSLADTLFLESKLRPAIIIAERPPQNWTTVGVAIDALSHRTQRLARLLDLVNRQMPALDAGCRAWLDLAPTWAEALVLAEAVLADPAALPSGLRSQLDASQQRLTAGFAAWLQAHYNTLHGLPYLPAPILGHQVAHFLAHRLRQPGRDSAHPRRVERGGSDRTVGTHHRGHGLSLLFPFALRLSPSDLRGSHRLHIFTNKDRIWLWRIGLL